MVLHEMGQLGALAGGGGGGYAGLRTRTKLIDNLLDIIYGWEWVIPENIHTIPQAASWNSEGEGGFLGLEF